MIANLLVAWLLLAPLVGLVVGVWIASPDDDELGCPGWCPCDSCADDAGWLDDQPAEALSDAEVQRRFARICGWVQ